MHGARPRLSIWRGKPLVGTGRAPLVRLPMDHTVLGHADQHPILLGRDDAGTLIFAHDISRWRPDDLDKAELGPAFSTAPGNITPLPQDSVLRVARHHGRLSPRCGTGGDRQGDLGWHRSHRFCARCGARKADGDGGVATRLSGLRCGIIFRAPIRW